MGGFYAVSDPFGPAPKLNALDAAGQPRWTVNLPVGSSEFPRGPIGLLLGADGLIYVGNRDGTLCAYRPDSTEAWVCTLGGDLSEVALVMGPDGVIYTASTNGYFYAVYSSSQGVADTPWPMWGHDVKRTFNILTPPPIRPKSPPGALWLLLEQ